MKKVIVISVIVLFVGMGFQPAFANDNNISVSIEEQQPRGGTFYKTFGGFGEDSGYHVQQTDDGGYIITGYEADFLKIRILLIKTNSNGNMEWKKTFGEIMDASEGYCVQQTTDEGYIIVGQTMSYNPYYSDVWLIKTDSNGNLIWDRTFGGKDFDYGYCVQQTNDDGYIITGGKDYNSELEEGDVWLIKTDSTGNMIWDKTFGEKGWDWGESVRQTTDGGYIVYAKKTGDGWYHDGWLIKTDSNGIMVWDRIFKVYGGECVQQTTDGGYIITGSYGVAQSDICLIKTNSAGNTEWETSFSRSFNDYGRFVQQTTDGGYIIIGDTWQFGAGGPDVWLIKTDSTGNKMWDRTFGDFYIELGLCVQQTTDGGYILTGDASTIFNRDVLLIKTNEYGWSRTITITINVLLQRILGRFPLLERLYYLFRM